MAAAARHVTGSGGDEVVHGKGEDVPAVAVIWRLRGALRICEDEWRGCNKFGEQLQKGVELSRAHNHVFNKRSKHIAIRYHIINSFIHIYLGEGGEWGNGTSTGAGCRVMPYIKS